MGYYCKECGLAVIIIAEQEPIRACNCNGVIIADVSSTLSIVSDISDQNKCQDSTE